MLSFLNNEFWRFLCKILIENLYVLKKSEVFDISVKKTCTAEELIIFDSERKIAHIVDFDLEKRSYKNVMSCQESPYSHI